MARSRLLAAALFGSTALVALPAAAQPPMTLTVSGGLGILSLPTFPSGPVDSSPMGPSIASGLNFSIDGVVQVPPVAGFDAQLGFSLWSFLGSGSATSTQTFSGPGTLVVPGYMTPAGTIVLDTSSGTGGPGAGKAGARSNINAGTQDIDSLPGGSGNVDTYGAIPDGGTGFLYGGIFTSGANEQAGAFGAIANSTGGVFIASGDLTGLTVTTATIRKVMYTGADLTLGLGIGGTADTEFSAFAGPGIRLFNQTAVTDVTVDIPERVTNGADTFPLYVDTRTENLRSLYFGGVVGFTMSHTVSPDMALDFGGKLGLFAMNTSFDGAETYKASGGSPLSVSQTATLANGPTASDSGVAYSVGLNAGVTKKLANGLDLGFGLGADFLSRVATLTRPSGNTSQTLGSDDLTTTYNTPAAVTPTLSFGSMVAWKANASLTGHF